MPTICHGNKEMSEKPNIIVIYTDQQRYDTLHCCGNPAIQTPNLDQLAREGCLFHDPGIALQEAELSQDQYDRLSASASHHLCPEISRGETKGVLQGHWKYCITSGDVAELYDLDSDPDELVNRAHDPAFCDVVTACHTQLTQWINQGKAHPWDGRTTHNPVPRKDE